MTLVDRQHRAAGHQRPRARRRPARLAARRRADRRRRARSSAIEPAGAAADTRIDAGGRCVIPGFVDSHTHLVFAGDRGDEFVARMAGAPYQAGGILTTVAATRAASDDELAARARRRVAPRRGATASRRSRSSRDTGSPSPTNGGCSTSPPTATADTTLLGAHVVPPEYDGRADDYVDLVCTEMIDCRRRHVPLGRRLLRAGRVRRRPVPRRADRRPSAADSARGCTPTSSATARACSWRSSSAAPRPTTARISPTPTSRRWPASAHGGDVPAGDRLLDPPAVSRRPARDRRRRHRGARHQLQPGQQLHVVDGVLHRARRARHADDDRGGAAGGDRRWRGGAAAARARPPRAGLAAPTRWCSTPPRTPISSTGPACNWSPAPCSPATRLRR